MTMANQASSPEDADLKKAWDNLCLNPHERELEEGRRQGREAGLKAGYREGYALGRTNAIEYGMEVGFIRGVVNYLKGRSFENNERMIKRIDDLARALDDFPSPEEVLQEGGLTVEVTGTLQALNDDSEQTVESSDDLDVRGKLQRVRAHFKLLMVQLGMPHFSLKRVMDDAVVTEKSRPAAQRQESSEW